MRKGRQSLGTATEISVTSRGAAAWRFTPPASYDVIDATRRRVGRKRAIVVGASRPTRARESDVLIVAEPTRRRLCRTRSHGRVKAKRARRVAMARAAAKRMGRIGTDDALLPGP